MRAVDPSLIDTLLNMSEGDCLDFKRDQYPFVGASDEQKGELLKDILTFANAWKTTDAYILIGIDENPGGRATVVGISEYLNDADLQQLVNSKTNVPVSFDYLAVTVDERAVGVVRIDKTQQRPIFLRRAYGKLRPNLVYIRRGSSTVEADPAEIARMGRTEASVEHAPQLSIELADPIKRNALGGTTTITSRLLCERPPPLPIEISAASLLDDLSASKLVARTVATADSWHRPDPKKVVAYRTEVALLTRLGFCVQNIGGVLVKDCRIVLEIPKHAELRVLSDLPTRPTGPMAPPRVIRAYVGQSSTRTTAVHDLGDRWEVSARIGKIQPAAKVWSAPFWVGSPLPRSLSLLARIFGDNVPTPIDAALNVDICAEDGWLEDEVVAARVDDDD